MSSRSTRDETVAPFTDCTATNNASEIAWCCDTPLPEASLTTSLSAANVDELIQPAINAVNKIFFIVIVI